ncbi:FERM domain-containing protein 4A-like isoform X2 [Centruroides vittatus]
MTEGRRTQIVLLDERRLEILVKPKLYAGELLDMVASYFNLKEKEYFGLAFLDETNHYNWLQLDKRVLEHDLPKKSSQAPFVLYFLVKYFVESITELRCSHSVEAFYLQAKSLVFKGVIETDSETAFQLAALVLQATYGDYVDDLTTRDYLKRLPVLRESTLKEHFSISLCEDKVIEFYKHIVGQTKGEAIVNYLSIVERLPTYGIHYYEVKDKKGGSWWLGINHKGISQYDYSDRKSPRQVFLWKQLDNLYYRDKKFSIEVHEVRRVVHALSSFNLYEDAIEEPVEDYDELSDAICDPTTQVSVSRRTFGPAKVTVFVWIASTPSLTKCIWSMAISQHQFYLNHKLRKSQVYVTRSLGQIAADLCRSIQSLSSTSSYSNLSRSASSNSLPVFQIDNCQSEESRVARLEMLSALKARKEALEEALSKKTEELKALCLKEGELSGELPIETPLSPGEPIPQVRRRIGTAFTLSDQLICKLKSKEEEVLAKLELDYEIQSKITSAAFKLANDLNTRKSVRKQRKLGYQKAQAKLKDIEQKLIIAKKQKELLRKCPNLPSDEDDCGENISHSTDECDNLFKCPTTNLDSSTKVFSKHSTKLEEANNHINQLLLNSKSPSPAFTSSSSSSLHLLQQNSSSAPPSPTKHRHNFLQESNPYNTISHSATLRPRKNLSRGVCLNSDIREASVMTRTHSVYSTSSEYDNVSCSSGSMLSLRMPYQNRFEASVNIEGSNTYNVPNRRTSQVFESQDDLLGPLAERIENQAVLHNNNLMRKQTYFPDQYSSKESVFYQNQYSAPLHKDNEKPLSSPKPPFCLSQYLSGHIDSRSLENLDNAERNHTLLKNCHSSQNLLVNNFRENVKVGSVPIHSEIQYVQAIQSHISEPELNCLMNWQESRTENELPLSLKDRKNKNGPAFFSSNLGLQYCNIRDTDKMPSMKHFSSQCDIYSSSALIQNPVSKTKIKEWTETNLDSPLPLSPNKLKDTSKEHHSILSNISFTIDSDVSLSQKSSEQVSISSPNTAHEILDPGPVMQTTSEEINVPLSPSVASHSFQSGVEVNIVSVGHFQPYWEETKPYEMADFYKYSTKHRKKQLDINAQNIQEQDELQFKLQNWDDNIHSPQSPELINIPTTNKEVFQEPTNWSPNFCQFRNIQSQGTKSGDSSHLQQNSSVADAFRDEMISWYSDQENVKKATLV